MEIYILWGGSGDRGGWGLGLYAYTISRVYVFLGGWIFADVESAFVIY